jgi:hypothetical protein
MLPSATDNPHTNPIQANYKRYKYLLSRGALRIVEGFVRFPLANYLAVEGFELFSVGTAADPSSRKRWI